MEYWLFVVANIIVCILAGLIDRDVIGVIRVEGAMAEDANFEKAWVTVTAETHVFEEGGPDSHPLSFGALEIGQRVQALFTGPVKES